MSRGSSHWRQRCRPTNSAYKSALFVPSVCVEMTPHPVIEQARAAHVRGPELIAQSWMRGWHSLRKALLEEMAVGGGGRAAEAI